MRQKAWQPAHGGSFRRLFDHGPLRAVRDRVRALFVLRRSAYANVYHCSVPGAGAGWFAALFDDALIARHSGLRLWREVRLGFRGAHFPVAHPAGTIVSPLYVSYATFVRMPKPGRWRAVFVVRDPRDVVLACVQAARSGAPLAPAFAAWRQRLAEHSFDDAVRIATSALVRHGVFDAMRVWHALGASEERVRLLRHEQVVADPAGAIEELLAWFEIVLPPAAHRRLIRRHTDARARERLDVGGGDWQARLEPEHLACIQRASGDLIETLGYDA